MNFRRHLINIAVIFLLGLTPLLWFRGNSIILGHDSGLTLFPVNHFLDRLFIWTDRYGFGVDQSYALPGFMIHGLEAFISYPGLGIQTVQKIVFIFWLTLPGLTMYLFASFIEKTYKLRYVALIASVLYMFNYYILQGWFIAERTKFSLYAALPLIMYLFFKWQKKELSTLVTGLFTSLVFFLLNGEGGLPLFGGIFVAVGLSILYYLFQKISLQRMGNVILLIAFIVLFSLLLQAYWIIPYGNFLLHSYQSQVALFGGLGGVLTWLNYVSKDSSLSNLFRLGGIPEWFENPLHPYAHILLYNPFFILMSFLFPVIAFSSLLVTKEKKTRQIVFFFSFLALLSMIFIAGSHPPFGAFYILMIKIIPGFIAFRTPFYKFAPALWFSFALLIGITSGFFLVKIEKINRWFSYLSLGLICCILLSYHFPFFTGIFFDYETGNRTTRVHVPQYVFDYSKWSEANNQINGKTLALPPSDSDNKLDIYTWGYFSNAPLTSVITNADIVNKNFYMPQEQLQLINGLYEQMKENNPRWPNLAHLLGIKTFLLRNDFQWNDKRYPTDSPAMYTKALSDNSIRLVKTFGKWSVYQLIESTNSVSPTLSYFEGSAGDIPLLTALPVYSGNENIFLSTDPATGGNNEMLSHANKIYIKPDCVSCNLQRYYVDVDSYSPLLIPGSFFYPVVKKQYQNQEKKLTTDADRLNFYVARSLTDALAIQKAVDEHKDPAIIQTFIDYTMELKKIENAFHTSFSAGTVDNTFLSKTLSILDIERSILLDESDKLIGDEERNGIKNAYSALSNNFNFLNNLFWHTSSETQKRFTFAADVEGFYSFIYKPNDEGIALKQITYHLDNQAYQATPQLAEPNVYVLPNLYITKGLHKLEIEQPSTNLYKGETNPHITTTVNGSCYFSNEITGTQGDSFRIDFQHKRDSGSQKYLVAIFPSNNISSFIDLVGDALDSNYQWQRYQIDTTLDRTNHFYVGICMKPLSLTVTDIPSIELQNISIRKLTVPDVILYSSLNDKPYSLVHFERKNQVTYDSQSSLPTPAIAILGESYSTNWQLSQPNATHFKINGFANGWLINKDPYQLEAKYKTQGLVIYGAIISIVGLIAGVLLLIVALIKKL